MKYDVLIADPDEQSTELLTLMFEENFNIDAVTTAPEVLQFAAEKSYQIIVLEYNLGEETGLSVCQTLANTELPSDPAIVFLTGQSDEDIIRQAYEYGISDYICKPYNAVAFNQRILSLSQDIEKVRALEKKDNEVHSMAETALTQSAYYGNAFELLSRLNSCYSPDELAAEVCQNLRNQGYNTAMELRSDKRTCCHDFDHEGCNPISQKVFEVLKDRGRIYQFGHRCMFNDDHVSLLVKNMPKPGTMSYDAMIDLAAKLVPAINARFLAILEHQTLLETKETLDDALHLLATGIRQLHSDKETITQNIKLKIGMSFHHLELEESQEQYLTKVIEDEINKQKSDSTLTDIEAVISRCVQSLSAAAEVPKAPEIAAADSADIELF